MKTGDRPSFGVRIVKPDQFDTFAYIYIYIHTTIIYLNIIIDL